MAIRFAIGEFAFLSLDGDPDPPKRDIEAIVRPGVDGVGLWDMGKRGHPFVMRSRCDAFNKAHARDLFSAYCGLIGADPVSLIWSDLPFVVEEFEVAVLNVQPLKIRGVLGVVNGLFFPSLGWVEAEWTLVAIPLGVFEDPEQD